MKTHLVQNDRSIADAINRSLAEKYADEQRQTAMDAVYLASYNSENVWGAVRAIIVAAFLRGASS